MEITGENYRIYYDAATTTVFCEGTLRLYGSEGYAAIVDVFNKVVEAQPPDITIDLRKLQFLNSSGINALSKFVIKVRNQGASQLLVRGSKQFPWQSKSLKNLQRLMPDLILELS